MQMMFVQYKEQEVSDTAIYKSNFSQGSTNSVLDFSSDLIPKLPIVYMHLHYQGDTSESNAKISDAKVYM